MSQNKSLMNTKCRKVVPGEVIAKLKLQEQKMVYSILIMWCVDFEVSCLAYTFAHNTMFKNYTGETLWHFALW